MENIVKPVDLEWVELIDMARRIGLTVEEIREFLRDPGRLKLAEGRLQP